MLLNNVVMYWSIYGKANEEFLEDDESIASDSQTVELTNIPGGEEEIEPEYWVCLPGNIFYGEFLVSFALEALIQLKYREKCFLQMILRHMPSQTESA